MLFPAPQHKADEVPSDAELARFIPGNAIAAGRAYAQAGRVLRMYRVGRRQPDRSGNPGQPPHPLCRDHRPAARPAGALAHHRPVLLRRAHQLQARRRGADRRPRPAQAGSRACWPGHRRYRPGRRLARPARHSRKRAPAPVPPREEPLALPARELAGWSWKRRSTRTRRTTPPASASACCTCWTRRRSHRGIPALAVQPVSVQLRKNGEFSRRPAQFPTRERASAQQPARFLRPSDRIILRRLARRRHGNDEDEDPQDTVRRMIATGRARWGSVTGPVANEGPPRPGRIAWDAQRGRLAASGGRARRSGEHAAARAGALVRRAGDRHARPGRAGPAGPAGAPPAGRARRSRPSKRRGCGANWRGACRAVAVPAPDELPPPRGAEREARGRICCC